MATHSCDIQAGARHIKGWSDFWRSVGLSTAGKVSLCPCLPTRLHSITAAGHSGCSSHPVQPSPPIQPSSTHISTHRDHLQSIWETFGHPFILYILIINDYPHFLKVKRLCPLDALQCLFNGLPDHRHGLFKTSHSILPTYTMLYTFSVSYSMNMVYCSGKHIKI